MTILGIIAALIAAVGAALWRVNSAAQAVRGLTEAAGDAHGLWRRLMWRRRLAGDRLELVTDPREAAAGMMVAVAQADGALTAREQDVLLAEFEKTLALTSPQAQELLAHARWSTGEVRDLDRCLFKLGQRLDLAQKRDVARMMIRVAAAEGSISPSIQATLERYNRTLQP